MNSTSIRVVFAIIVMVLSSAISAQLTRTANGIIVQVDKRQVGIFANNGAFCLSLNDSAAPATIHSVFIDESKSKNTFTVVSTPPVYGIKTPNGKLSVNTKNKSWSLYDASGKMLVSNGQFSSSDSSIRISQPASGLFYGAGNKSSKQLTKTHSASSVGNGVADIPYFWTTAGYSAFGVSSNDDNPAVWNHPNDTLTWTFKGKAANLYLWPAKTMYDGVSGYVKLTGRPKLPPRWAFGYLQSQWGWADSTYISNTAATFRDHQLPVDALIFDFEWYTTTPDYAVKKEGMEGFSDFTFNPKLFPHPTEQIAALKKQNFKFIGIRKPRLGSNLLLDTMRTNGWLLSPTTDNRDLNFSNAGLRNWYEQRNKPLLQAGVDAWWDDEGESYYSCYYWWNLAQRDLLNEVRPGARHFTLNRAFSPGNQRFGYCTWNGDITATWDFLAEVPQDLLNFSLAGMTYGSCDIGGFHGTPTKEMLVRWFQAGVFIPIMRAHSDIGTKAHFPFLWDEDGESAMRKALNLRYQLLPYVYSLGHEAYSNGSPIMRPLAMEFSGDTSVTNLRNEWLLGKGLLAAPLLNEGGKRSVYLPKDTWYDFYTGEVTTGPKTLQVAKALDETPVYVRAGTILPLGPVIQYSEQASDAPLEIHVYPGKNGTFNLVEDDGVSDNYVKGLKRTTTFTWNDQAKMLSWNVTGSYAGNNVYKKIKIIIGKNERVAPIGKKGSAVFR